MKTFLFSLVLTLAVAASLIVIIDRFQGDGGPVQDRLAEIDRRLAVLEKSLLLAPPVLPAGGNEGQAQGKDAAPPPGTKTLGDVVKLLQEIEGMILDAERGLRRDLTGVYEKLLARIEEVTIKSSVPENPAEAKRLVREKLAKQGVTIAEEEEMIELSGEASTSDRALEFLMVAPGGRAYESLLVVDVVPSALKIGMEDLGFVEADPDPETWEWAPEAKGAYVYVLWEGLKKPRRAEDLILDHARSDCMSRSPWMFTASRWFTDTRTWERHFAADFTKGVAAITFNYTTECLLACPLREAANENNWFPHPTIAPRPGTKVRVFIRKEPKPEWDKFG